MKVFYWKDNDKWQSDFYWNVRDCRRNAINSNQPDDTPIFEVKITDVQTSLFNYMNGNGVTIGTEKHINNVRNKNLK
jgi:hypothetical protein